MSAETGATESRHATARRAGFLYLVMALLMIFAFMVVPGRLVVWGDAAETARRITDGESFHRLGILAALTSQVLFVFVVLTLYRLFRDVDRGLARLLVALVGVGVGLEIVSLVGRLAPLHFLGDAPHLAAFTPAQLEALSLSALRLGANLSRLASVFWGLWLFPFGLLVIRSGFLPRLLGFLLLAAGFAYVASCASWILLPAQLPAIARVLTPLYFGEVPILLWLLVRGAPERSAIRPGAAS